MVPSYLRSRTAGAHEAEEQLLRDSFHALIQEQGFERLNEIFRRSVLDPATPGGWTSGAGLRLHRLLVRAGGRSCDPLLAGLVYDICFFSEQSILVLDTLDKPLPMDPQHYSRPAERQSIRSLSGVETVTFLALVPDSLVRKLGDSPLWDLPPAAWSRAAAVLGNGGGLNDRIPESVSGLSRINGFRILELLEAGQCFRLKCEGGPRGESFRNDLATGAWLFQEYPADFNLLSQDGTEAEGSWFSAREFADQVLAASRLARAFFYTENLHRKQRRRGGQVPYTTHLIGVASIAMEYGADQDEAIAALLHDSIEDQGGAGLESQIGRLFGARVLGIVEGCTERRSFGMGWKARKLAHLERMRSASPSVALVYASDKLHNMRSMLADLRENGARMWDKFHAPRQEQLWYYREVAGIFRGLGHHLRLIDELERTLADLERLSGDPR